MDIRFIALTREEFVVVKKKKKNFFLDFVLNNTIDNNI